MASLAQAAVTTSVAGASSAVVALGSNATIGNTLVLKVCWLDTASPSATTLGVPADANGTWLAAKNPTSALAAATGATGAAIFYEVVASATKHSSTVSPPGGGSGLYCNVTIEEWSGLTATPFDVAQSNLNNSAASTTTGNSGTTATLAQSGELVVACVAIACGTGLSNAGISDPPTGYTTVGTTHQNTSTSVGSEFCYNDPAGSTSGQICTWTWTSDATMLCYQAAIATLKESGGGGTSVAWWV